MKSNFFRFSIGFLLFVCLCVAGFLAGNRAGYRAGYSTGIAKRKSEKPYPKMYEVARIIRATEGVDTKAGRFDYGTLMQVIESSVYPDQWETLGGNCTVAPIPALETLVVNATPGVHNRLNDFLANLSSVEIALDAARAEREEGQRRHDEAMERLLTAISEQLGEELKLINEKFELIGTWSVQEYSSSGLGEPRQYVFLDSDSAQVPSPDGLNKSVSAWYLVARGSVVISGQLYVAATTNDDALVLVPASASPFQTNNGLSEPLQPQAFLLATRDRTEP